MNKVVLIGRLTKDPDIYRTTGPGDPMCIARFLLAVDRRYTKQDGSREADFISCKAFGKAGEFVEKYFNKGQKVAIVGRIQTGSYEKDGRKVYTTDVIVEEMDFCEKKVNNGTETNTAGAGAAGGRSDNNRNETYGGSEAATGGSDGFMDIPDGIDDELPFS